MVTVDGENFKSFSVRCMFAKMLTVLVTPSKTVAALDCITVLHVTKALFRSGSGRLIFTLPSVCPLAAHLLILTS